MGRPHGVAGELYLDGCPLTPERVLELGTFEWRGQREGVRTVRLTHVKPAATRLLITVEGVRSRDAAAGLVNGLLWAERSLLPDPGPGMSYAFQLTGMRVVDASGHELGVVADVVFNVGQPLLQLEGREGALLPCQPPFMKHVDVVGRVITLDLPPGFDEF